MKFNKILAILVSITLLYPNNFLYSLGLSSQIHNIPMPLIYSIHTHLRNLSTPASTDQVKIALQNALKNQKNIKLTNENEITIQSKEPGHIAINFWIETNHKTFQVSYENINGTLSFLIHDQNNYSKKYYLNAPNTNMKPTKSYPWLLNLWYVVIIYPFKVWKEQGWSAFKDTLLDLLKWFPLITIGKFLHKIISIFINLQKHPTSLPSSFTLFSKQDFAFTSYEISETQFNQWDESTMNNPNIEENLKKYVIEPLKLQTTHRWTSSEQSMLDQISIKVTKSSDRHNPFLGNNQQLWLAYGNKQTNIIYINDVFYQKTIGALLQKLKYAEDSQRQIIEIEIDRLSKILQAAIASEVVRIAGGSNQDMYAVERTISGIGGIGNNASQLSDARILLRNRHLYNLKWPEAKSPPQKYFRRLAFRFADRIKHNFTFFSTIKVIILEITTPLESRSKRRSHWLLIPFVDLIRDSLHASIPMKENPIPGFGTYLWALQEGYSDDAAKIIAKFTIDVDNIHWGFIPILGNPPRHFNFYLHLDSEFENHQTAHMGLSRSVEAVTHYHQGTLYPRYDHSKEMDEYSIDQHEYYSPSRPNTMKEWFVYEFRAAVHDHLKGNTINSLRHLGLGLHSAQDVSAHREHDPGPYSTGLHPDYYDDPFYDQNGKIDKDFKRVHDAEKMSKVYLKRYKELVEISQNITIESRIIEAGPNHLLNATYADIQILLDAIANPLIRHTNPDLDQYAKIIAVLLLKDILTDEDINFFNLFIEQLKKNPHFNAYLSHPIIIQITKFLQTKSQDDKDIYLAA